MDDRPHNRNQQGVFPTTMSAPKSHQIAAEEVRAHLVSMRGGAPFLSPSDAYILESWLTEGISIPSILYAIERAALARRTRRSRVPLTLGQVKRHLKKSLVETEEISGSEGYSDPAHPLAKLALKLQDDAKNTAHADALNALAQAILALEIAHPEEMYRRASTLFRKFLEETWDRLPEADRESEREHARRELGGISDQVDESVFATLIEEVTRDRLRRQFPLLCCSALKHHLVEGMVKKP